MGQGCVKGCDCQPANAEGDRSLVFAALLLAVPPRERERVLSVLQAIAGANTERPPARPDARQTRELGAAHVTGHPGQKKRLERPPGVRGSGAASG